MKEARNLDMFPSSGQPDLHGKVRLPRYSPALLVPLEKGE
jgi:hypothetical protein